ncbi:MAG: metallophosphoesterase [Spirochaetes bacterium]|jgi:Icc-related predicted phosphoesterase|nr:metallophosphoesterase [Spirochaetota bacterium]
MTTHKLVITMLLYLFMLSVISCTTTIIIPEPTSRNEMFIVWAHSDIQPKKPEEKFHYEDAIKDVTGLSFVPDMAIVAGDLVNRKNSQMYWDWMKQLRQKTAIPYWYEISGNHDHNDIESYLRNSGKPMHYTVRYGNLLFIFLSDETKRAVTHISDEVFQWWKEIVIQNSDSIIITITHAPLKQSQLISTYNWTMRIDRSERFWEIIKKHNVDIWISAHDHLPGFLSIKSTTPEGCNTLFLDVSSIHKTRGSPIESWMLFFKNNSNKLTCAARSHEKGKFYTTTFDRRLSRPFINDGGKPVIKSKFEKQNIKSN